MTIYAICYEDGRLMHSMAFRDPMLAQRWFEVDAQRNWENIVREEGLPEAAVPTIEWHEIETPPWAAEGGTCWAGMTGDAWNPVIVAALTLEERRLP
jgi:hypothetical protein